MKVNEPLRFVFLVLSATIAFIALKPLQLEAQPVVIGQPADTSVCNGGRASFYVLAVNTVAYHWQENDGVGWYNIDQSITYAQGYTTPLLIINDANLGLNGYKYRCVVTDGDNNSVLSNYATLGVNEPPVITTQPQNMTVCKNDVAYFNTSALYADSYQWQESVGAGWIDITNNAFYSGVNSPELFIFTTTGMNGFRYRCRIVNGNCPDTTQFAMLFVNPTPTLQTVTGGGSFCAGGQGLPIGLSNTEAGIAYHLYRNGNSTGVVVSGTGEALTLGNFQQAGVYSVIAINGSTSCQIPMLNTVSIEVNPLPLQQQLLGGGSYCDGSDAPEIFLASSQQGVQYELFKNGVSTSRILNGSGFTLSFGPIAETGFYTVAAKNTTTACATQMNGNVQVIQYPLPQVFAGNDQTISQGSTASLTAQVSGSSSYMYQWQPAVYVQQPQQANTQSIALYQSRIFTIQVKDMISQCLSPADSLKVVVTGGPLTADLVADATSVCPETAVSIIANASGGTGVYLYSWTSEPPGFSSDQSSVSVSPSQTTTYTLLLNDGNTSITKSITINVHPLPQLFEMTGGGNYCVGNAGLNLGLTSSQAATNYTLLKDGQFILTKTGTGSALDFGSFTESGIYTAKASGNQGGCSILMNGSATITSWEKPTAEAGPEQLIANGETALLQGSATGGSGNYQFSWTPVEYLINPNSANAATLPLTSTRQFQLRVTDQNSSCQSNADQTVVFVSGTPVLQVNATASSYSICQGETVQLTALASGGSGNYVYSWTSAPGSFSSNIYNPVANPDVTTTYLVSVSDGFLSATGQFTVVVRPGPAAYNVVGGGNFCSGGQGREVKLAGSESGVFYSLLLNGSETGILRQGTGDPISFSYQQTAGNYQVKAFSPVHLCGSEMTGSVNISVSELPVVSAGNDVTIPLNGTTLLTALVSGGSGNYAAAWAPSALVAQPAALQTNTLPLTATTNFTITVTDQQSGCISLPDTKTVFISGTALTVQINTAQSSICSGSSTELQALTTGGTGSYTYYWTSEPVGFFGNTSTISVSPTVTTVYKLEVSDGLQTLAAQKQITVNQPPASFDVTGGGNLCNPASQLQIGLSGSEQGIQYKLLYESTPAATLTGNGNALSFGLFNAAGSYTVHALNTVTSCLSIMNGEAEIKSSGQVIADAGPDKTVISGGQTVLEGNVVAQNPSYTFTWTPSAKLINPQALQPTTIQLTETTVFRIVAASQGGGCLPSEDFVTVFVSGTPISINIQATSLQICPGQPIQLIALVSGGNGNYSYSWTSTPGGQTSAVYNPVFYPAVSTSYLLTVSDGTQSQTASIDVIVKNAAQIFSLQGGGLYCASAVVEPFLLSGSENGVSYTLMRNGISTPQTLSGNGGSLLFDNIQQAGTYTIKAETSGQCQAMMNGTAEVGFRAPLVAVASPDQTIVTGATAVISVQTGGGSGNYSYQWTPANMVQNPTAATANTLPLSSSAAFSVVAQDVATGCVSMADTTLVLVSGVPLHADILASATSICQGNQLTLTALPEGGSGNYSFIWKDPAGSILGTGAMLTFSAIVQGNYSLMVIDGAEAATATKAIEILSIPESFTISGGGYLCQNQNGLNIQLSGSQTATEYSLIRNSEQTTAILYGTGSQLSFQNNLQPGTYTIQAKNLGNACAVMMPGQAELIATEPLTLTLQDFQTILSGQTAPLSGSISGGSGNFGFQWQPSALVVAPQNLITTTLPLTGSTVFQLGVSDVITGCHTNGQTYVLVNNNTLSLEAFASEQTVCPGSPVQLFALATGGNGPISYAWNSIPEGFTSNIYNPVVSPQVNTVYSVTVSDGFSQLTKSIQLMVKTAPQLWELSGGGIVCSGTNFASVNLSSSESGAYYTLFKNNNPTSLVLNGTGQPLQFNQISAAGTYTVYATLSSSGCNRQMNGEVSVQNFASPLASAGSDQSIPFGQSAYLSGEAINGSGYYNYFWNPSYLTYTPNAINTNTVSLTQSQLFYFHVADQQSSCISNVDTTMVVVTGGSLGVEIIPGQGRMCAGASILLTALPSGGSGNYTYSWTSASGQNIGNEQQLSYQAETSAYVYVHLTDGANTRIDSAYIEVDALPQSFSVTGGGALCNLDQGIMLGLENSEQGMFYTLIKDFQQNLMTVTGQGEALQFGLFSQPGIYTVEASLSDQSCKAAMAGSALIQQFTPPVVETNATININSGETVQLTSQVYGGSGSYTYQWSPAENLFNPTSPNPLTKPLFESVQFSLEVTDSQSGCTATDQTFVYVSGSSLAITLSASSSHVCTGETVICKVLPTGGAGNYTMSWTTNPPGASGSNTEFIFTPFATTMVRVTVNDNETSIKDSVLIQTWPQPQSYELTGGGSWCQGSTAPALALSGSETGVSYSLFRNGFFTGLTSSGTGQPLSWPAIYASGTYTVEAQNANNCKRLMTGSSVLQQLSLPVVHQFSGGGAWCEGMGNNGVFLSGSEASVNYQIIFNGLEPAGSFNGTGLPISLPAPQTSGSYTVNAVYQGSDCAALMRGSASVLIYPLPATLITGPTACCESETIRLQASGGDAYSWNTVPVAHTDFIDIQGETSKEYSVTATNSFGCSVTVAHNLTVNELPDITLRDEKEHRKVVVDPGAFYPVYRFWSGNRLLAEGPGMYYEYGLTVLPSDTIFVEAESFHGCTSRAYTIIEPIEKELTINAFSPNSDNINDKFLKGNFIKVYNRWGLELYSGFEGWDGRYNGAIVAPGTYYYIMELRDLDGNVVRTEKGSVTIVTE